LKITEQKAEAEDAVKKPGSPVEENGRNGTRGGIDGTAALVATKDGAQGSESFEFSDPAEVLVELARRGELDPWDIDIAKTTDRFLAYIDSLDRRDLRIPARTLLYASILLRMKSDAVEEQARPDEEPEFEGQDENEPQEMHLPSPPLRRRTKRPVTLNELILELKKAEMVGRRRAIRESEPVIENEIQDLSHEEGIEERISALLPVLDELFSSRQKVCFEELKGDRIMNYVSLLFMAHRGKVWLDQEEMFGDMYLHRAG
jgi:segregation and condensation protein A